MSGHEITKQWRSGRSVFSGQGEGEGNVCDRCRLFLSIVSEMPITSMKVEYQPIVAVPVQVWAACKPEALHPHQLNSLLEAARECLRWPQVSELCRSVPLPIPFPGNSWAHQEKEKVLLCTFPQGDCF